MPADFTRADVERIAQLARLELTEHEKDLLTPQLSNFLAFAEQVQQVATAGVPPTSHPLVRLRQGYGETSPKLEERRRAAPGAWRDDVARPSLDRAEALAQAPEADAERGLFKVPRVLA